VRSLRTISDSAALARATTTVSQAKERAAGIAGASLVGVELHMHRDVDVCSIGNDELTAVLLLRQQCGHAAQPAPGLWNGRRPVVFPMPRPTASAGRSSSRRAPSQLVGHCNPSAGSCSSSKEQQGPVGASSPNRPRLGGIERV
jgi:hypothetical protein